MAQFAPVEKEWDFYSKSLWVSLFLPCTWEVLTYYNFYLCMCMCVHVCIWACMYVWICIYMWKPEDSIEFHSSGDVSWGLSIPWSLTRQVDQPGKPRVPLPPTSHYWDFRHTNILYVFWASNSGPYVYWRPISLVFHFLFFIYLGTQGTNWPD